MTAIRRLYRDPRARTAGLVLLLLVVIVGGSIGADHQPGHHRPLDAAGFALLIVAAGSVALCRRWPLAALAVALGASFLYRWAGYASGPIFLAIAVTLYRSVIPDRPWRSVLVGAVVVAGGFVVDLLTSSTFTAAIAAAAQAAGWTAAVLLLAHWLASRRAYIASIKERARLAEQTREEEAQRRVTEERLRIARELHDVVSHSISMINVQAGVAAHVMAERPEKAQEALVAIKSVSKEALRELRGILGVLRDVDDGDPRAPAPGLSQLEVLVETAHRAGLPTRVSILGEPRPLSPAVDLAAYRIVQESLTNALRHAGPASAAVTIAYETDGLVLQVADDGKGEWSGAGTGNGIRGMRERALAVGGELEAGRLPGHGYRVKACLPY